MLNFMCKQLRTMPGVQASMGLNCLNVLGILIGLFCRLVQRCRLVHVIFIQTGSEL